MPPNPNSTPDLEKQFDESDSSRRHLEGPWWRKSRGQFRTQTGFLSLRSKNTTPEASNEFTIVHQNLRHQALDVLFGLPPAHLTEWEGLHSFLYHMETCFTELLDTRFAFIWKLMGQEQPSDPVLVWAWCFFVIDAFKASKDADPSIDKICRKMLETVRGAMTRGGDRCEPNYEEKKHMLQAIFAVLCWTSATLEPIIGDAATQLSKKSPNPDEFVEEGNVLLESALFASNCSRNYSSSQLRRPASLMFHTYRLQVPTNAGRGEGTCTSLDLQPPGINLEDMLYEPSLTFDSLQMIGRVGIKWVDTLTAHLSFNRLTRELSVYRYPSFCVAKILSKQKVEVVEKYVHFTELHLPA
ncbi:unnamed protein product [Clonostachys byssicola]|uniref:Uncharacterized protein n=1 Tax=Clonostachys byssicola TaxID=160290 RepID=A0A9N9UAV1_9HYPO|nr:unnamed protein product [Clonostachys byssicola]